jgi:N-formylglutamate deformylase
MKLPFFITIPHAGESIPAEASWLQGLVETLLMSDVDRYVDELYGPAIETFGLSSVVAETHRYVVDLNRVPEDVDQNSVEGSTNPPGLFSTGFHWTETMLGATLMSKPISAELHQKLVKKYYAPFHAQVKTHFADFKAQGFQNVFQLDAHSMPSKGSAKHRDPGGQRPQIVVSDRDGKSCAPEYKDLVIAAYKSHGFEVAYNWPYKGGRITEVYGQPQFGQHTLQVEMNRALYMDEITKQRLPEEFADVQKRLTRVLGLIIEGIKKLPLAQRST